MIRGDEIRALRWACQAWRQATDEERVKHAVDAARAAWRLGADAARVAELGLVETAEAAEILAVTASDDALLVEESFTRWFSGDRDGALGLLAPEARIVDHEGNVVAESLSQLRAHLAASGQDPAEVRVSLDEAAQRDGVVLLTAVAEVRRTVGGDVERLMPVWVCEVADGAITGVRTYLDAGEARRAAGFDAHEPRRRMLRDTRSWRFAARRPSMRPRLA